MSPSSSADYSLLTQEELIADALAKVLSDACNVRYYHPMAFTGNFISCSGRSPPLGASTEADYNSGMWQKRALPIPREARDPTNTGSQTIPEWALILGCIAAAILGWAIGMLLAFAACPKLPVKSLKDRLLSDQDEEEEDLSDICRAKISKLCSLMMRCGSDDGGKREGGGRGDDQSYGKRDELLLGNSPSNAVMMSESFLSSDDDNSHMLPSSAFMTSPQRHQHYSADPMAMMIPKRNEL